MLPDRGGFFIACVEFRYMEVRGSRLVIVGLSEEELRLCRAYELPADMYLLEGNELRRVSCEQDRRVVGES